ncbi:MAG: ABC transporter ATP-binding protein/permease [Alphaproteobacteria bacterium]|nr:ABC transporter ATP-binding protein/permease [Alphaproteobacteria bacterium]
MQQDTFPKTLRGFYWLVIKKFPWYFGIIFLLGVIRTILTMIIGPLSLKWMMQIYENAVSTDWFKVFELFALLTGIFASTALLQMIVSIIHGHKQQIFNRYKLYLLFKRIYANDISFFIDNPSGQIVSQAQEVNMRLNFMMEEFGAALIGTAIGFLLIVGSMITMNIWFVVILLSYGAIKVIWEWMIQKRIKQNSELEMEESSKYNGLRSDSLNNALTVKYFANQEYENMYIYKERANLIKLIQENHYLNRLQWVPTRILWIIARLGMLALCFVLIKNAELGIPNAVFIISSAAAINDSFSKINELLRKYSVLSARAVKAYNNVIVPIKITDKNKAKKLRIKKATIDFENVSFAYGKNKIFHNFNLHINNAEKVGIVGLSGAGKTTLCNLLIRMYDVDSGKIKIEGADIRDIQKDSLLRNISYVPQETVLFNRTIFENIKYASPSAKRAEVINVAKKANIHDFIMGLPDGYNTLVGNNGVRLSGGQRQRVSIARE